MIYLLILLCFITAYLFGSVPTGYLIARAKGIDIREHGSGNIGGTNVSRILGTAWGIAVMVFDALKAIVAVLLLSWLTYPLVVSEFPLAAQNPAGTRSLIEIALGIATIAGNVWNIWLGGKGGKGVATAIGIVIAVDPTIAVFAFAAFIVAWRLTRFLSFGSLVGTLVAVTIAVVFGRPLPVVIFFVFALGIIAYSHRENLQRLANGQERKT
jgi:acyl phosphate:glycerol-3-phosphate acyltransferase